MLAAVSLLGAGAAGVNVEVPDHVASTLTPYLGQTLYGVVEDTWVRGHHALHNGVPSETPCGSILLRKCHE